LRGVSKDFQLLPFALSFHPFALSFHPFALSLAKG